MGLSCPDGSSARPAASPIQLDVQMFNRGAALAPPAPIFDDHLMPDAELIPMPPRSAPRFEPRASSIRIRIDGVWYDGYVQRWARLPDGWAVWLRYQADPEHPTVAPVWGWFRYDPETIRTAPASPSMPPHPA